MRAWLSILPLGVVKIAAKLVAPIVVLFMDDEARVSDDRFGVRDATDLSWWNIAVRNGAHNMFNLPTPKYTQTGNRLAQDDWSLEHRKGFQWRVRRSEDGGHASFRMTWGKPHPKGKKELYSGWTMDSSRSYMRLSVMQLRMRSEWAVVAGIALVLWRLL